MTSIVSNIGAGAIESMTAEKKDRKKVLKYLKAGESVVVRIVSAADVAEIMIHNVYQVFNSTVCTGEDYYDKAVESLYSQANATSDEKLKEELKDKAYQLKAKPRYFFAMFDLETGEEILLDLSKKQAAGVYGTIKKMETKLDQMAFEISKADGGSFTVLPVMYDLSETQQKNWEATAGKTISADIYENASYVRDAAGQLDDLKKFGFDISLLGVGAAPQGTSPQEETPQKEAPYGF